MNFRGLVIPFFYMNFCKSGIQYLNIALVYNYLLLLVTRILPRDGGMLKNYEPQEPGNSPGSGPEVVERQRVANK